MRRKVTLFKYLYDTLTMQIQTEKIRYGESLPSIRQLCQLYNVGIRTVKDVLKAMRDEGFIRTEVRKSTIVVYKRGQEADSAAPAQLLLARREAVLDVLQAMACFFPHIIASGALLCDEASLESLEKKAKTADTKLLKDRWCSGATIIQTMISQHKNALLTDLYIDMGLYGQVPVFSGLQNPFFDPAQDNGSKIQALYSAVKQRDYTGVYRCSEEIFCSVAGRVSEYLDDLSIACPRFAGVEKTGFEWNAKKGRLFSYMEIARQIMAQIAQGVYREGELIPTITELAEEYHVSPATVGKALSVLNRIGFLDTVNGRGSLVTASTAKATDFYMKDAAMKRDADTFLCAIQLWALTCKTVALLGFDNLDKEAIGDIAEKIENAQDLMLPYHMVEYMVAAQPYESIRTIYRQIGLLQTWGYYFVAAQKQAVVPYPGIREQCHKMLNYIKQGEKYAFSDVIQDIYINLFTVVKDILIRYGAAGSAGLEIPKGDSYMERRQALP